MKVSCRKLNIFDSLKRKNWKSLVIFLNNQKIRYYNLLIYYNFNIIFKIVDWVTKIEFWEHVVDGDYCL